MIRSDPMVDLTISFIGSNQTHTHTHTHKANTQLSSQSISPTNIITTSMFKHILTITALLALFASNPVAAQVRTGNKGRKTMKGKKATRTRTVTLDVTNLAFNQPFSPFFVMVHDASVQLYKFGYPASDGLKELAENGSPAILVDEFAGMDGVMSAEKFMDGAPFFVGGSFQIEVEVSRRYPLVTIASMAINTNDMFVALNGIRPMPGNVYYSDGLDAGTETNNELCSSIPGPGCPMDSGNLADGEGEGVVHVHRGFHGVGDLPAVRYDWRNPMMRVEVEEYY